MAKRPPTSFRLSDDGRQTLEALTKHWGINMVSVIEIALRDLAKAQDVKIPEGKKAS